MKSSTRVLVNTGVQYTRSIINSILNLYSTRIIIQVLGVSDYGLFTVVGGVVALLGFITNALIITTQRYLSYNYGKHSSDYVRRIFCNSLFLHILIAVVLSLALWILKDITLYSWLSIGADRVSAASHVYDAMIAVLIFTVLAAPYKALFIARENIVYVSLVEIADAILKLSIALSLTFFATDHLVTYSYLMAAIQFFNLAAFAGYATLRFDESVLIVKPSDLSARHLREMLGFASWTTYGAGSILVRNQGIAILINRAFGFVANAAYGTAMQIHAALTFISTSVLNALNPQIMKAEGEGDRARMLFLAERECKYSTMLLMLILVPVMFEIDSLLHVWLGDMVPEGTAIFANFILASVIIDQMTYGLNSANQATGRIRNFVLLTYTPKMLTLIFIYIALKHKCSIVGVMSVYVAIEAFVSIMRIPYLHYSCQMDVKHFLRSTVVPLIPLLAAQCMFAYIFLMISSHPYRFLVSLPVTCLAGVCTAYFLSIDKQEREFITALIKRKRANND